MGHFTIAAPIVRFHRGAGISPPMPATTINHEHQFQPPMTQSPLPPKPDNSFLVLLSTLQLSHHPTMPKHVAAHSKQQVPPPLTCPVHPLLLLQATIAPPSTSSSCRLRLLFACWLHRQKTQANIHHITHQLHQLCHLLITFVLKQKAETTSTRLQCCGYHCDWFFSSQRRKLDCRSVDSATNMVSNQTLQLHLTTKRQPVMILNQLVE